MNEQPGQSTPANASVDTRTPSAGLELPPATGSGSLQLPGSQSLADGQLPTKIGRARIERHLGQGHIGLVYAGHDELLDIPVAVKVTRPEALEADSSAAQRFLVEARVAIRINHDNIVRLYDVGEWGRSYFLSYEYVGGGSLAELLEQSPDGRIPTPRALDITLDIARALVAMNRLGIVHRDIKPSNILLTTDGQAKLADLGLAKQLVSVDYNLTQSGNVVGTPYFMAPEQAISNARVDIRTDVYALGATLYQMLVGRPPFDGGSLYEILHKHQLSPAPAPNASNAQVPTPVSRLCQQMMSKRPEDRCASPERLVEQLQGLLEDPAAALSTSGVSKSRDGLPKALPKSRDPFAADGVEAPTAPTPSRPFRAGGPWPGKSGETPSATGQEPARADELPDSPSGDFSYAEMKRARDRAAAMNALQQPSSQTLSALDTPANTINFTAWDMGAQRTRPKTEQIIYVAGDDDVSTGAQLPGTLFRLLLLLVLLTSVWATGEPIVKLWASGVSAVQDFSAEVASQPTAVPAWLAEWPGIAWRAYALLEPPPAPDSSDADALRQWELGNAAVVSWLAGVLLPLVLSIGLGPHRLAAMGFRPPTRAGWQVMFIAALVLVPLTIITTVPPPDAATQRADVLWYALTLLATILPQHVLFFGIALAWLNPSRSFVSIERAQEPIAWSAFWMDDAGPMRRYSTFVHSLMLPANAVLPMLLAAALFTLANTTQDWMTAAASFPVAIGLAWCAYRGGSVLVPIAIHLAALSAATYGWLVLL